MEGGAGDVSTSESNGDSTTRGLHMTGLGATIYFGLFAIAAAWLFVTSEHFGRARRMYPSTDQAQRPDRSNSTSVAAEAEGSSPRFLSHS
jgi:hypothetical protein